MAATSLNDLFKRLHRWARKIGLSGAHVRLFTDKWCLGAPFDFADLALNRQAFEPLRIQRIGQALHYLGPLNCSELLLVLPQAKAVRSVAMSQLGGDASLGLIVFSSRDPDHYSPDQGTHLLHEVAMLLPDFLTRWVESL